MHLGVVSDTHGHVANTLDAVRMLESLDVDEVIHCGDIGTEEIIPLFQRWPTHFVFGNVDGNECRLAAAIEQAGQTCHGRFGTLELDAVRIAFLHGDDSRLLQQTAQSGDWGLVCYGHTHEAQEQWIGSTLVLNPGALYRARPHSIALVELPSLRATLVNV